MAKIVVVDDGFAQTKVAYFDEKGVLQTSLIPSLASQGAEDVMDMMGRPVMGYETDGATYTVGSLSTAVNTGFDDYKISGLNRCIVHAALMNAGMGGKAVKIGVTLPFGSFYDSNLKSKRGASLTKTVTSLGGADLASIQDVFVYPESAVAWFDTFINDNGDPVEGYNESSSIAIIDVGGRSTDIAVFHGPGMIDKARSGTIINGVSNVVEAIRRGAPDAIQRPELNLSYVRAENAMHTGKIKAWGKDYDIPELVASAKKMIANQIFTTLKSKINDTQLLDRIVFIGGGAKVLENELVSHNEFPQAEVAPNPEYANARGILKYMTFVEGVS